MASEFGLSSPMQQRKRLSQISGLLAASIDNSSLVNNHIDNDQDDAQGKKRKHLQTVIKSEWASPSLFQHTYKNVTSDGKISLQIIKQPERQHRARYQTEGSRGAIKDRSQNMFPSVQLKGFSGVNGLMGTYPPSKPPILQVFIGNDQGDPIPHIYYQACKVAGKNSTPCHELKKEGTDVILIDMDPARFYEVNCDCVGILKERASDIENKKPHQTRRTNWRKKTTKCRMVFRTEVENANGDMEVLQVVSDPISCTQLPGTPEITKMSLSTCSTSGGEELWMIGKNFLKDCVVVFQESACSRRLPDRVWVKNVEPLKDYFHSTHLIVIVPPYSDANIKEAVRVNVTVKCGGKESDNFVLTYLPTKSNFPLGLGKSICTVKGNNLINSKQRVQSNGGNGSIEGQKFLSNGTNGTQDDYSPAQSLNKVSASSRGTRSSTTDFTSVIPTSNSNLSTNSSTTHNSSSLTIKSSKSYNKSRITILEQLDCSSSGSAARKARGSKRSKDSKYRSSLPRKIEQPDIYSDETLFDTVDTTNISQKAQLINNQPFQPLVNENVIVSQIHEKEKRNSLTTGSPDKKNKNNQLPDTSSLYSLLQSSFPTASNSGNQNNRPQDLLQNLSAPSPASVTNYRDFSEDSTSIISQDDATLNGDSDDSSRMSSASVSTIKDDTLVSSITIATPFTNDTAPVTRNLSKPHVPLSFLGITKKHKQIADGSTQPSSSGNQVSSTTPESKLYKEENVTQKEDSCLIEAMESHSAMISTPTNEATGHVYNFTNSQFGTGMMSDQRFIKTDPSNSNLGVGNMISAQQQQIIIPSADLIQQQKIIQHNLKQIHIQSQENAPQLCQNINQDTLIDASAPGPSSLNTLTNNGEFEASKLPVAKESNVLGAHQASPIQEPVQPVNVPKEKCKYSIANAESEVASISIKLPPSILSNQDRLESIVNTINKAITTPPASQKDSQQAAEMIASININSAINSPPQQQQVFAQNAIQTQQSPQPQAFTQGPNTMQIENNSTIVAENISSGNNISTFNTQQLQSDQNNQVTQNWGYEEDGADAKKIKVSPTEKEICDAAAVIATNAINNISSATASTTTSIHQATSSQCFNEVSVPTVTVASNTWTNNANTSQNFNNPVLSGAQGTTFVPSTAWEDESKNANKVKIIEVVPAQPAPTLPTAQTSSTNTTLDAVVAAANVTNAINAAAESLKGIAASSILDAQAATNALNAAAAAASATNSLNAATALAVASVTGNHESSIQNWAQTGNQNVLTNSSQISQHNFNSVEAPQTFSQPSNIWNGASEQANSPASKEQTTVWNNTAIQQQQGSFDSGSAIDFGSLNSSAAQTWTSKNDGASECRSGQVEQAQGIPTSDVWQTNDNLSPSYVSATNASNNYSTPPSSVWNTDNQDPKAAEQAKIANAPSNNATSTNSPGSLTNWHPVNSPESLGKVQESVHPQGATFSPVTNWNEGGKDIHNSPAATSSHTNNGYSKIDNQQPFNGSPQVWNNQGGDGMQLKTASNINTDSQMWDLTQENSTFQAQNVSKGKNISMNASSELHQTQTIPSNTEETVGNSTPKTQTWESSSANNNEKQGNLTEEWNSPITNDPMLSETSVGVIQQQQKAEESWPSYNTNAKSDNQWSATVDNIHVSQQPSKSDWTSSFNQQPNSENPSNDNSTWPTFSTSSKPDSGTIVQPAEQQEQQKEPQESWPTFTDQSTTKWQAQPQEIAGTTNKLGIGTVDAAKTGNWPSFENACKSELQSCQPQANWNNFKIETGKETSDWKIVPNQQSSNSELSQPQQESTVQANNWTSSTQPQQQVSQEKWLENKESEKWLQGTNVSQQTTTTVNETWGSTINIENKVQQSSASSSVNAWSESINSAETKQQQTWNLSAQQSVQSLPINVPSIASSDVRSVLNNDTHHPNMNSSEMLVVDPKDTSLSLEQSTSLKESTPMEVDTASYDNPLLTPNPTIH